MNATTEHGELRTLLLAVSAYTILFIIKVVAYSITGVLALLAESLHSLTDIAIAIFLIASVVQSRKAADEVHMYGHARAQNVAVLVAATLFISFTSVQLYEEAIQKLLGMGTGTYQQLPLALSIVILSMVVEAAPLVGLLRHTYRGPAATAQLTDLINDELALVAVLIGTVFLIRGVFIADPIAVIIVATVIAVRGGILLRENVSFLLGRSPGAAVLKRVEQVVLSVPGVRGVHELRGEYIGPEMVHLEMHITVAPGTSIEEADKIADVVSARVMENGGCQYCTFHVEPDRGY